MGFDCIAFQREQRERISRMLNAMTREERVAWLCTVEPQDPVLRRVMHESPRGTLHKVGLLAPDVERGANRETAVAPAEAEAASARSDNP